MLRVRRTRCESGYIIDNGEKYLVLDENYIDFSGHIRNDDDEWLNSQNKPLDKIVNAEVGGVYDLEDIPEKDGAVIMSMNEAALGWVVLTYNFNRWNFGIEEYQPELLKCKWKVLSL